MAAFVWLNDKPLVMQQDLNLGWKTKLNVLKREKQVNGRQSVPQAFIKKHSGSLLTYNLS